MRAAGAILPLLGVALLAGCFPRAYLSNRVADTVSSGGEIFGTDDDPELIRDAVPFALKAEEVLLSENPGHRGLLLSLSKGFAQYAAAFVWQEAVEEKDRGAAEAGKERARRLFLRAKEYGLRGLEAARPGFRERLAADLPEAVSMARKEDVPLLFWAGASWSLA
ncbi:MAG TPA: TRAP transporter TatT component family protein, partial [Candidatus Deferrimicrobiaceae bacterium]